MRHHLCLLSCSYHVICEKNVVDNKVITAINSMFRVLLHSFRFHFIQSVKKLVSLAERNGYLSKVDSFNVFYLEALFSYFCFHTQYCRSICERNRSMILYQRRSSTWMCHFPNYRLSFSINFFPFHQLFEELFPYLNIVHGSQSIWGFVALNISNTYNKFKRAYMCAI